MSLTIRFRADGSARTIYSDQHADFLRGIGFMPPTRASHIEPIESGPDAWQWYVDLTPLGEDYAFCLWPPSPSREAALQAERDYIQKNWVESMT